MFDVTFIIPAYNCESSILRAVDSIYKQNIDCFEILIVDDCSTDGTPLVLDRLERSLQQITIITSESSRLPGGARNLGLNEARGDYVIFLDADDSFVSNGVRKMLDVACFANADVVACGAAKILRDGSVVPFHSWDFHSKGGEESLNLFAEYKIGALVGNKLFRRKFLLENDIKFVENIYHEDIPFIAKVSFFVNNYISLNDIFLNYFENSESVTNKKQTRLHLESYLRVFLEMSKIYSDFEALGIKNQSLYKKIAYAYGAIEFFPKIIRYAGDRTQVEFCNDVEFVVDKVLGPEGAGLADFVKSTFLNLRKL